MVVRTTPGTGKGCSFLDVAFVFNLRIKDAQLDFLDANANAERAGTLDLQMIKAVKAIHLSLLLDYQTQDPNPQPTNISSRVR